MNYIYYPDRKPAKDGFMSPKIKNKKAIAYIRKMACEYDLPMGTMLDLMLEHYMELVEEWQLKKYLKTK